MFLGYNKVLHISLPHDVLVIAGIRRKTKDAKLEINGSRRRGRREENSRTDKG
jgi:hypothetical protein